MRTEPSPPVRAPSPMDRLIRASIAHRLLVVIGAALVTLYGALTAARMPLDVFPDLTAPTVTVVSEAHGLAPQEVEVLVTVPIEAAVNGATDVRRVRSVSGIGISVVWIEFAWGVDVHRARQIVSEKLQGVAPQLPSDLAPPTLAPISSIMGEILFLGLRSDVHAPMEVREVAERVVRRRLLSVPGVAQVVPIGGGLRQVQVAADPERLLRHRVTFDEVVAAVEQASGNATGGVLVRGPQEALIRALGRAASAADLGDTVVALRGASPVLLRQVADVLVAPGPRRGEGSSSARPAVILGVMKQPGVNTLELTEAIDAALTDIAATLPEGMVFDRDLLRQADFIETAVGNVATALRDGAILVALILLLFLLDARATFISLTALPLSLLGAVIVLDLGGIALDTMTLGGLTIAIGALVDDAIIDVENVFRRLREERTRPPEARRPAAVVVYEASREIRGSIVFATLIVMLVFLPMFFLTGVEGRLLAPLALAYLIAIFASLIVAVTVTPALCSYLLPAGGGHGDSFVVRGLKRLYRPSLRVALGRPWLVLGASAVLLAATLAVLPLLGRTFLPEFNEGALTVSAVTLPGTSLEESDRLGRRLERILLDFPEVVSTARRTGRAELDEHAQDVNASEIDVRLRPGRDREALLAAMRGALAAVPGVVVTIGQPISHRIDHMLSGTRASIAVKLFGDDLYTLRVHAEQIRAVMAAVDGAVDVSIEQQVDVPELAIQLDRERMARFGLRPGAAAEAVEAAFAGHVAGRLLEGQRAIDVVVRYREDQRADRAALAATLFDTPSGAKVPLGAIATLRDDVGPNTISRENGQRKIVVMANVAGRDLGSVIDDIRAGVAREVALPPGYHVVYGGQFESQREATRTLLALGAIVIAGIFLLLYLAFRAPGLALLVMINLPLALIGGVVAVWLGGGVLSVGSLVGFVTLFGIATRNGIMMISHIEHLRREEGAGFDEAVERGALERLSPILMTALCAGLALLPLVIAGDAPGNEIQAPMGVVILGGLLSSTALNMIVVPALYARFFRPRGAA